MIIGDFLFLNTFGKAFVPKSFRKNLHKYFLKAGYEEIPYYFFGALFWLSAFFTYLFYMAKVFPLLSGRNPVVFFAVTFIIWTGFMLLIIGFLSFFLYFYFNIRIYNRTKMLEDRLPEYLTMVSTNIKGGFSFEKALWASIKPELGVLANEIALVSKQVMTGRDLKDALIEFSEKYDSPILKRTINLIVSEVDSGGKIAHVIDRIVRNLKKTRMLKKEMAANTLTYMIFIGALVMFVTPILFALSYQLFHIILGFLSNLKASGVAASGLLSISGASIDPTNYRNFSIAAIIIIGFSSSFIISVIEKGDFKNSFRYAPMFVITGLIVYFVSLVLLSYLFSSVSFG